MVTTSSGGGGGYPVNNGVTQVSLIHSSDSVRTVSTAPIYRPTSSMSTAIKKSSHTTMTAPFISANPRCHVDSLDQKSVMKHDVTNIASRPP
ncbi:hypothetical protein GCK72_018084 [Caenorhabditis remanei]|uniref:Uncharacterized protein n=1 Tax=Caenorhabditis remanei TaxID=31234 RepID=A0A6A5G956_CAERE|nr:hypothetical protein GCK72_018084 [Caenorhabditis remanei]KAF1751530.1 hypothetical protein GCK72_018084 [Caenorhabditis remanei]